MKNTTKYLRLLGSLAIGLTAGSAMAGTASWDFTTDPTTGAIPITVSEYAFDNLAGEDQYWKTSGGNPGGFLGLTWSLGSRSAIILFPDIDDGKLVTSFKFDADLRIGSPQQDVNRAADGFSINFARSDDPVFTSPVNSSFAVAGAVETGTQTGLAISFDTWSGNTLPDGADIEGIIVRIDNKTVLRQGMPTRNGACADATSLQTGPSAAAFWAAVKADPVNPFEQTSNPDAAFLPDSTTNLCWQHLSVELDNTSKLTVIWKGVTILDKYQTEFFPSAGGLILAGRTGGADQSTHLDNLVLTTTATANDVVKPTDPTALAAGSPVGATYVSLTWGESTDDSGRVAYEVERDGVVLSAVVTSTNYVDIPPKGGTTYTYRVRAKDVSLNYSGYATLAVTTAAETTGIGTVKAELFRPISGTSVDDNLKTDQNYIDNKPASANYGAGGTFGSPNGLGGWNDTFGDNYGARITGVLTPTETAQYNFFIRSDDASQFYLNTTGSALPDTAAAAPLIQEIACCSTFLEPGDATKPDVTTATPISLTAGTGYGFVILLKEGGGGDGVGVAMRKVGDTTPAANVPPISPLLVTGNADPVGAVLNFNRQPASKTIIANERASFDLWVTNYTRYGNSVWYQWLRDGVMIPGATGTNYVIPVVASTDNAAKFSVAVGVPGLVKTSAVATLTVSVDTRKPLISRVGGNETLNAVDVTFSEPVTAPTATTAANYTFDKGLTASAATLVNQFTVRLTTAVQTEATVYTLTVNNVADNAGNAIVANSTYTWKSWSLVPGRAKMEVWDNIAGVTMPLLYADPKYELPADRILYTPGMNTPDGTGENYGARTRGYLIPKETASFNFFTSSDDASELYLSMNAATWPVPNTDTPIAQETDCCQGFVEPGVLNADGTTSTTTTTPIALTAGTRYPMIAMLKEGGGGDYVRVAMRKVGDTTAAASLPYIVDQMFWFGPDANILSPSITNIVASSTNSPAGERATNAIDGNALTKYLNFDKLNTGFTVTPASATTVRGIALTSANDAPERDPATYEVWGSVNGTSFTLIGSGAVTAFPDRFIRREMYFDNATAYTSYKVVFPTVVNATAANSMQIADVELLGYLGGTLAVAPSNPTMSIATAAGVTTITYTGTLQSSATADAGYTDVAGATSPYTVNTTTGSMFYRARN